MRTNNRLRSLSLIGPIALALTSVTVGEVDASALTKAVRESPAATGAPIPGVAREGAVRRFALVIGSNETLSSKQAPLRFADDDAARVSELLREVSVDVELVTTLDRDSQALFTGLVGRTRHPRRADVLAAHKALVARMERARAMGSGPVEYLIYYSGHGDVGPDGKGFLTLSGGDKLTRHDLFVELLGTSPADHNHIIVDACRSEEFVLSRGSDWKSDRTEVDYSKSVQQYLDRRHLGQFPNTGVVLASSADQQTHEWERYRSGIFTHELLSGLRGGADINGDGDIEYSELGAFVSAANSGVNDPRARLKVVVRPPRDNERLPVLAHTGALKKGRVLLFTRGDAHGYTVEDRRGVRLADLRRSGEQPGYLRLPAGELFVYRRGADAPASPGARQAKGQGESAGAEQAAAAGAHVVEARIAPEQDRLVLAQSLTYAPTRRAARGALDQAFRDGLFAVPYGVGYYSGYTDRTGLLAVQNPQWEVKVWREVNGELVEVSKPDAGPQGQAPAQAAQAPEGPEPPDQCYGDDCDDPWDEEWVDDDDWDDWVWRPERFWGALSVGAIFATSKVDNEIRLGDSEQKVYASHTQPWTGPLRGFDIAWQTFTVRRKKYPVWVGYFRSGYTRGTAAFAPRTGQEGFAAGEATSMTYGAIPIYFGGNVYLFNNFPLRPFAGFGLGFDILIQDYQRHQQENLEDVRARVGFELHAGVEARITNYVALRGEIQQLWGATSGFDDLPNFSNTSFTVMSSVAFGFPLVNKNKRAQMEEARRKRKEDERRRREDARREASRVEAGKVRVEIRRGDERVVVESQPSPSGAGHTTTTTQTVRVPPGPPPVQATPSTIQTSPQQVPPTPGKTAQPQPYPAPRPVSPVPPAPPR